MSAIPVPGSRVPIRTIRNFNFGVANPVTGNPLEPTDQRSADRNIQHRANLDARDRFIRSVHLGRLRATTTITTTRATILLPIFSGTKETVSQDRRLTNAGVRSDISYVKGIHNFKAGVTYQQTFLIEKFNIGIVDPTFFPAADEN